MQTYRKETSRGSAIFLVVGRAMDKRNQIVFRFSANYDIAESPFGDVVPQGLVCRSINVPTTTHAI